jgi:hypothetical protein
MTREARPVEVDNDPCRTAFGVALHIDPRIDAAHLGRAHATAVSDPPTRVRLDPEGVARLWDARDLKSVRRRELRDGEEVLFTVDFAETAGYLLWAWGFGRVLVSLDGTDLLCDPEPGNPDWTALLNAQALPLVATLRGLEVLHASAVMASGTARLFTGEPGAGKSSIAAALVRSGAQLVSDDVVALEDQRGSLVAHPGPGMLQLRHAETERLSPSERQALDAATPPNAGKQRFATDAMASPTPFGELFLLERSVQGPIIERLESVDPFALLAATFNISVRSPARLTRQLDLAVKLAATGSVHRLRIQPDVDASRLASILNEHFASTPI